MKLTRRFLLLVLILFAITGLMACNTESIVEELAVSEDEKISLNLHQADLIANLTDNEKYLNKNYLYNLVGLEDSDNINVIITIDEAGLVDSYNKNNNGYTSLMDYASTVAANNRVNKMITKQEELAQELIDKNYINEVKHSYTTLFNGFSAQTTYGQYKKLVASKGDYTLTVSEAYSMPEYQLASTSGTSQSQNGYEAVTNFVNVYETGIFNSSNVGYDGSNTAVAILDSGFDIHHTVFQNMPNTPMISQDEVDEILTSSKAYNYYKNIKVQDVYINSKIPFAYDYADKDADVAPYDSNHGTHVAGIIGGKDDVITGVAINTQLVLMKVFGDINNGAIQDDILAALEDAVLLGVDAINLSLGSACGFSSSKDNEYINVVYNKIEAAGISLVVAASNDYSSGYGGENSNTNKASNPDSATVGSPGTYSATIAVASISGVKSKYMISEDGYTFFFNNANNNAGKPYDFYDMLFEKLDSKEEEIILEYVTVPGVGKKVNYTNIDVKGKIALVKRGDISFEEKAQVALSQGAIGCIIYNNIAGEVYMNAGSHLEIAFCSISKDDGEYLASKGTGRLVLNKNFLAGPFMSDFSSWGPVSDLSLKPEITAHGGSILSSVPGGGYEEISGTSMACPNLCGVIILVKQALKERYPELTAIELTNMANSLLMSTATIVLDESGNPYSPRKQGSGLGNLEYAVETLAYLSVENQIKPKLELLDDKEETGKYVLKFEVNNVSDQELQYNLTNLTMTESLSTSDPRYVAEKAYMLNPKTSAKLTGDGSLVGDVVTVKPNGKVEIEYTLQLKNEEIAYIRRSFINGMYVEGFAVLESLNEDGIDLSIPFLAFFGDWTVAPMFDKTFYEVESEAYNGAIDEEDKLKADYYATTPLGRYYYSYIIPLGSYVYEMDEKAYDKIPASEEHAAIGYNLETINGITTVYAGLLRNARKMVTTIKNANTGEIVYEHIKYDEHKAYFSGSIIPGYDILNITAAELGLENNTKYTFTMEAFLDYEDGGASSNLNNTFEFSFYIDYQAPIITDAEFYSKYDKSLKDYRYYVDVYVYDNHYAQSIRPFTIVGEKLVSLSEYVIPIYSEKGAVNKVTLEITDYMDLLQYGVFDTEEGSFDITNGLGFLVDDYALNQNYTFVTLPGTNSSNIAYKEEYYSKVSNATYQYHKDIYIGDTLDLTKMLTSDDPTLDTDEEVQARYFANLKWTTSDENVIRVKNGQIEAVGSGTAIITCSSMNLDGYEREINLRIRVREKEATVGANKLTDINFTYFETLRAFANGPEISEIGEAGDKFFFTEKSSISFYPSEQVKLYFELEPWNLTDYELIWASTNDKVATVDENGVVTAIKEGNATITLKVKIGNKTSTLMASTRVSVKNEFIIEGTTLVGYKGNGGRVVIPADEGILYIGAFAFSLYTTDYEIEIEEDDYDAAKTPASNNTVTSVIIPSDVMEVQKYAFYNCTALETVTFLKDDKGESCDFIREYAFAGCTKLKNINLENIDLIGIRAFMNCTSLEVADIAKVYALGAEAFKDCTSLKFVDITALRNAGIYAFAGCTNLEAIANGEFTNFSMGMFKDTGLKTLTFNGDRIPNNCFENCKELETVIISNDLVYVGTYAFNNCTKLETVTFNNGSEFIYEAAFNNCTKLETIVLPNSSFDIETKAFNNCTNLTNVVFNDNTYINNNVGSIFKGCTSLSTFSVSTNNANYKSKEHLLVSKDGKTLILAPNNYDYGTYKLPLTIKVISDGAFSSIENLTELIIPRVVNKIGKYAFENCSNLTKVTILSTNVEIDEAAFRGCNNLSAIENIENISYFAPYVFAGSNLSSLELENVTIDEFAFANSEALENIIIKSGTINNYAFINSTNLVSIYLDVTSVGSYAFKNCIKLANINTNELNTLSEGMFEGCESIVTFDNSYVQNVGDNAFRDCTNLTSVNLPNVVNIGSNAFSSSNIKYNNKLTEINFSDSLETIGEYAFYRNTKLQKVTLGKNVTSIGKYAFSECSELVEFNTTSTIKTITECLFAEDTKLVTCLINGVEEIESAAFINCESLVNVNLENVTIVKMQAFNNCKSLEVLNIPNVITLEAGAFLSCENVASIYMPKVEYIGAQAISCVGVKNISLPETVSYIAPTAFYYNINQESFTDMNDNDTVIINEYVRLDKGVLYTVSENGKYILSAYPTNKFDKEYTVLFNTLRIEEYAGYFNKNIEKLIFPDTLKLMGNMCFYGSTNIKVVEFRSTVAPIFEGTVSSINLEYNQDTEVFKLLNKYLQFNGYYPLYYGQFKDMIGITTKMDIVLPANVDEESYNDILYQLYFNLDTKEISTYEAMNETSIDYLNKVEKVPSVVTLDDEQIIKDARTAYNVLSQDLTLYGYSSEYLNELYNNLVKAEEKWNELKYARINKVYDYLIKEIEALGPNYEFSKISDYYKIAKTLEYMDRDDKKYIDVTNVNNFKTGFDEYFKELNEDINVATQITTLPTSKVNKVGYVVLATTASSISIGAMLVVIFKRFILK